MEADLIRFYGVDYRDRWRYSGGIRRLTLRRLWVLVRFLPEESAVARIGRNGAAVWSVEAHLLDDIRMALTGTKKKPAKPHSERPQPLKHKAASGKRRRALADGRERQRERQRAIDAGEIT